MSAAHAARSLDLGEVEMLLLPAGADEPLASVAQLACEASSLTGSDARSDGDQRRSGRRVLLVVDQGLSQARGHDATIPTVVARVAASDVLPDRRFLIGDVIVRTDNVSSGTGLRATVSGGRICVGDKRSDRRRHGSDGRESVEWQARADVSPRACMQMSDLPATRQRAPHQDVLVRRTPDITPGFYRPRRAWCHTRALDHPGALRTYERAGFSVCQHDAPEPSARIAARAPAAAPWVN